MRLICFFAGMVFGYTVLAQPKGLDQYDTVDYSLEQYQEQAVFGRIDGGYYFGIEHKLFANQKYATLTKREIVAVMNELERILKANALTLNDYTRILAVDYTFFSANVTAENAVKFYQLGMGNRIYGFLYEFNGWEIQMTMRDSGIGFSINKTHKGP